MGGITNLFGGGSKPKTPPVITPQRAPTTDDAAQAVEDEKRNARRKGRLANIKQASVLDTADSSQYATGGKSVLGG